MVNIFKFPIIRNLYNSKIFQRLKHISLSNVPPQLVPWLPWASRLDHCLETGLLTFILRRKFNLEEDDFKLLFLSAILHDAAIPPFGHISDEFLKNEIGVEHDDALCALNFYRGINDILSEWGFSLKDVCKVISGNHFFSPFIRGIIDLDNIDNMYMGLQTMVPPVTPLYHPSEIVSKFSVIDDNVGIYDEESIIKWLKTRKIYYSLLEDDPANIYVGSFLRKTVGLLTNSGLLDKAFFFSDNEQAIKMISENAGFDFLKDKKYIIHCKISEPLRNFNARRRRSLEDEIADLLNIESVNVSIAFFKTSTVRDIPYLKLQSSQNLMKFYIFSISIYSQNKLREDSYMKVIDILPIHKENFLDVKVQSVYINSIKFESLRIIF